MKVDIPKFEERLKSKEFIDWLNTVEQVFDYKEDLEHRKVKLVAIKLRKHASIWWDMLIDNRNVKEEPNCDFD